MRTWILSLLLLAACGDEPHDDAPAHVHSALFGGLLVEVGDHLANIELVHDPKAGTLSLYVLDGHAQAGLRIAQMELALDLDGTELVLRAQESSLTGDRPGDSSRFSVENEVLRGRDGVLGRIRSITIRGETFRDVEIGYPEEQDG